MILRQAIIDLSAIEHNYKQVRRLAPNSKVLAMLKSDAYGHGLIQVAKTLSHCDAFGVSVIEEALALRRAGITQRIVLMTGVSTVDELELCVGHHIDIVVHQREHLEMLRSLNAKAAIAVWLKLDVAMHRLGFMSDEFLTVYHELNSLEVLRESVIIMSHLPNADMIAEGSTKQHIQTILDTVSGLPAQLSIAKSAGILAYPQSHQDWVRPGIMLYGISPFPLHTGAQHLLKPVMTFQSKVVAVRHFKAGDAISYGGTWRCPEDMTVAIAGTGYSDGYPRLAKSGTSVLVDNQHCQLIGRVCMDMLCIDCRNCPQVKISDTVTLWGESLPIERVAESAQTIAYELTCHVTDRVRVFVNK